MSLWFHRYRLVPRRTLGPVAAGGAREGVLLRTADGFADVHPWPELGDAPLDEQLRLLAQGETTPITAASLRMAAVDGDARRAGRSLFEGATMPESHWPGSDPPPPFDTVKVKDAVPVDPRLRLRIDFNARLSEEAFLRTARKLPRDRIDFVEDPCPWDAGAWRRISELTGLRLALDLRADSSPAGRPPAFDVLVFKPARNAGWPLFDGEIVVTSYMDHPVGQLGAAWVAATNRVSPRCGLVTHVLFEEDPFIERMQLDGARLLPPPGTGVGFDDLLAALPWKRLA